MTREQAPDAEIFALKLYFETPPGPSWRVRTVLRSAGLIGSAHVNLTREEVGDLLGQIERQYGDFSRPVRWQNAEGSLGLDWNLDPLGHVTGRLRLRSLSSHWSLEAPLKGDQSYLPQLALELRLLLRPGG